MLQDRTRVPFRELVLKGISSKNPQDPEVFERKFKGHPATIDVPSEKANISHPNEAVGKMKRSFLLLLGICDSRFLGGDLFPAIP